MNGFLNLLKPPGMTSSDAVCAVRRTLSGEKTGHAGTLDPEAAGVLPIMVGKASRLFGLLTEKEKEYIAEIAFGAATDTQDAQGSVVARSVNLPDADSLLAVLPRFTGEILQLPPAYSALKINGRPAYALARKGEAANLAPRAARIDAIELLEAAPPDGALLRVVCGRGVYIRTLCHDIGAALGCPAHLRFLLRTKSGVFHIENSVTLEEWRDAADRATLLSPMDAPLWELPAVRLAPSYERAVRNGQLLRPPGLSGEDGSVRLYCGDRFAGLAKWRDGALAVTAMLLDG